MAEKTVMKLLLSKYAPLSIDTSSVTMEDQPIINQPTSIEMLPILPSEPQLQPELIDTPVEDDYTEIDDPTLLIDDKSSIRDELFTAVT